MPWWVYAIIIAAAYAAIVFLAWAVVHGGRRKPTPPPAEVEWTPGGGWRSQVTVRAVTALVPEGPGLRYWSDHSYDALIDDTLTPTVWDEDEPAATTARAARRIHFTNVAAGTDMAGATARSSWGCASGHNGTGPSIPGAPPPEPSPRGGGLVPSNVRGRSADTPSGP